MTNYMKFTLSQIKYLICLYRLSANGCGVKNIELANALGLSKPSVHYMLKSLSDLGMVAQETSGLAHLTEVGYAMAQKYAFCYVVIERKMTELCGNGAAVKTPFAVCSQICRPK